LIDKTKRLDEKECLGGLCVLCTKYSYDVLVHSTTKVRVNNGAVGSWSDQRLARQSSKVCFVVTRMERLAASC
jgi:hypothetical protein